MNLPILLSCMYAICLSAADTLAMVNPQDRVDETAGGVDILVARYGAGIGAITVDVQITPTTAVLDTDYGAPQPATLSWTTGATAPQVVHVPILATAGHDPDRYLTIGLANAIGAIISPAHGAVNLSIVDNDVNPAGTLVFLADDPQGDVSVRDDQGCVMLQVLRSGGTAGDQWLTIQLIAQDAVAGVDYVDPGPTTLHWTDNEGGAKTLQLDLLPRSQALGTRSVYAGWSTSTGNADIDGNGWTVAIADSLPDAAGTMAAPVTMSVAETAGSAVIHVARNGGSIGAVSVDWAIDSGFMDTATHGVNYGGPLSGTLTWGTGDSADQTITIPLIDDGMPHATLSTTITFSNPSGGLIVPFMAATTLAITDDDHGGLLGFTTTATQVDELAGTATCTVTRSSGSTGDITVDWTTADLTAVAGIDYIASSGTLSWLAGDISPRTITVSILHPSGIEPNRWFSIYLQNPQNGAGVDDDHGYVSVTIRDADGGAPDLISLATATTSVHETAGQVTVTFHRSGSGIGPTGVQILLEAGTAQPVLRYGQPSTTTVTWDDGVLGDQSVTVPIIHDGVVGPTVDFRLYGGLVYGNAELGSANHTTISILDDDGAPPIGDQGSSASGASSIGGCGAGAVGCMLLGLLLCASRLRPFGEGVCRPQPSLRES
jgi:hypothetical protein